MKTFLSILLIFFMLLIVGCDPSIKPAGGLEDEIYVVADSLEFEELKSELETTFEKIIYTPQPEKLFTLIRIPVTNIEEHQNKKNIVIIAPLNSSSTTSKFIKAVVDSTTRMKFEKTDESIIKKYDLWAKDQLVMILTARNIQELQSNILNNKDDILYSFQKLSDKRLYSSIYNSDYEQKDVEGRLLKDYGWIIYVPTSFVIGLNKPDENFVWLKKSPNDDMDKWIFVYWIENASPELLTADSIKALRNILTKKFYQTPGAGSYIVIDKNYYTSSEIIFKSKYAILTQGLWESKNKKMNGPFINYTFYDEKSKRLYMLDGSVYAPNYYKRNLIQQMDVTLQSFMMEDELNKERREDLLNAVD